MILVTGATGFIGRALVRQLSETGKQVRVLLLRDYAGVSFIQTWVLLFTSMFIYGIKQDS